MKFDHHIYIGVFFLSKKFDLHILICVCYISGCGILNWDVIKKSNLLRRKGAMVTCYLLLVTTFTHKTWNKMQLRLERLSVGLNIFMLK